jgi:uncharacterized protein (TIGR04562 family)
MRFDPISFESMIGGLSTLDIPRIHIQTADQAKEFLLSYGYDVNKEADLDRLWGYHRKAVAYVQSELLQAGENLPEVLVEPNQLKDIWNLFIYASTQNSQIQRWACGLLKVMHIFVHLENDLFAQYSAEIQEQLLKPIRTHVREDAILGSILGPALGENSIRLKKFEEKAFKTTTSSVTKLLAKPELVAFTLMDKVGVRFITKHLVDVFRVLRYLIEQNLVNFTHNIADQSINTVYPLNLFLEVIESMSLDKEYSAEEIDARLMEKLEKEKARAVFKEKFNTFTSSEYRFLKFITRRLVRVNVNGGNVEEGGRMLNFFYPFEVQIVNYESYLKNLQGPASHDKYKERQVRRARARIFGFADLQNS